MTGYKVMQYSQDYSTGILAFAYQMQYRYFFTNPPHLTHHILESCNFAAH